jgi:uncharacterized membrane protein YfcA
VDLKLGLFMVIGTVSGVEIGARIIEFLQDTGALDLSIGITYIFILVIISGFTAWESIRAIKMVRTDKIDAQEAMGFIGLARRIQSINIPPMVSFPVSGIEYISIWMVLAVGLFTGILAGSLGVGGGFIRMPLLVYVLGIPTHVAVGTDLFEIVFSSGFGTITHAIKGNVDILMALVMQTGAVIGAQIGATATRFFAGPRIRLAFSVLPMAGAIMVAFRLFGGVAMH